MMKNKNSGVVVIDSSKEKNEKLKKKWSTINEISSGLTNISTSGFIVSLLSPFEFDGPIIEIVTAVLAALGFVMKKISESKLKKIDNKELLDNDDKQTLLTVTENLGKVYKTSKTPKSR